MLNALYPAACIAYTPFPVPCHVWLMLHSQQYPFGIQGHHKRPRVHWCFLKRNLIILGLHPCNFYLLYMVLFYSNFFKFFFSFNKISCYIYKFSIVSKKILIKSQNIFYLSIIVFFRQYKLIVQIIPIMILILFL